MSKRAATLGAVRVALAVCVTTLGRRLAARQCGDWLIQYAYGDHGIVVRDRFARAHRVLETKPGRS